MLRTVRFLNPAWPSLSFQSFVNYIIFARASESRVKEPSKLHFKCYFCPVAVLLDYFL